MPGESLIRQGPRRGVKMASQRKAIFPLKYNTSRTFRGKPLEPLAEKGWPRVWDYWSRSDKSDITLASRGFEVLAAELAQAIRQYDVESIEAFEKKFLDGYKETKRGTGLHFYAPFRLVREIRYIMGDEALLDSAIRNQQSLEAAADTLGKLESEPGNATLEGVYPVVAKIVVSATSDPQHVKRLRALSSLLAESSERLYSSYVQGGKGLILKVIEIVDGLLAVTLDLITHLNLQMQPSF